MPKKYVASWDGSPNYRWTKMINGKRHRITCNKLGLVSADWTKERSYDAARAYFEGLAGQHDKEEAEPKVNPEIVRKLVESRLLIEPLNLWAPDIEKEVARVTEGLEEEQVFELLNIPYLRDEDNGLQKQIDLALEQWKLGTSFKTQKEHKDVLKVAVRYFGEQFDVTTINSKTLDDYYAFCFKEKRPKAYRFFIRLVNHLASRGKCELPRNINEKRKFPKTKKAIIQRTDKEVMQELDKWPERQKLYGLLVLNCSMQNVDTANISHERHYKVGKDIYQNFCFVDWEAKTLTRTRSKHEENVRLVNPPVVTYRLWDETFRLLQIHRDHSSAYVLTSSDKTKLVVNGTDLITQQMKRIKKSMTLKDLRSIGSSAVKQIATSDSEYWSTVWLGNSPETITSRHYANYDQRKFDKIVKKLGEKYGFKTT